MENTILVTGAGGFIGSAVTRRLVKGIEDGSLSFADGSHVKHVIALVRHSTSLERLQELPVSSYWSVKRADMTDQHEFPELLNRVRPRVIMHLALDPAVFTDITESEMIRVNIRPLEMMFEYLSGIRGSRFIHTGSAWVLDSGLDLAEDAVINPRTPYARAKLRIDELLPVLQCRYGVDWINLRVFNVYGKYESRKRLLPYLISTLPLGKKARLTHGNQVRDFNDVDDVAEAYVLTLQADNSACNQIYHIGTGCGLSIREFAEIIAGVTGNVDLIEYGKAESQDQDLAELVANPALAKKKLGWSPPQRPDERIKRAARWWLEFNARS